jgi:integrase
MSSTGGQNPYGLGCSPGLDRTDDGTHSMRRTKATLIDRRNKNLRDVQLLLGHSKLESTGCAHRAVPRHTA